MSILVKNIIRFILLILVQVYVLDKIHIHFLVTPYIYLLFILWMPFSVSRPWQLILGFLLGFTLDSFQHNPGFHASACILIAYIRPFIINIIIPQEGADANYDEPSVKSLGGFMQYFIYITVLILVHNAWLFMLQAWRFGDGWYFIIKTLLATAISIGLVLITELLFFRKQKFKTNTI